MGTEECPLLHSFLSLFTKEQICLSLVCFCLHIDVRSVLFPRRILVLTVTIRLYLFNET